MRERRSYTLQAVVFTKIFTKKSPSWLKPRWGKDYSGVIQSTAQEPVPSGTSTSVK